LTAGSTPQWGKFDAPKMVVHCADALRMALGRLPTKSKRLPIRHAPLKQLFVYWLPWPKGVPTARELLERAPADWDAEVAAGMVSQDFEWPEHPAFGRMSRRAWGVLGYRHLDHHFRQFGV
jgi:hypothetical protein